MKYKIIVNLNRVTIPYQEDFEKARLYYAKHQVDIEFVFKKVDVNGYQSIYYPQVSRWLVQGSESLISLDPNADANMFVFNQEEWANPAGSKFPLQPNTPNGNCMTVNGKPYILVGTYIFDHNNGQVWLQIAHEIMHSLVKSANLRGLQITDIMDTYFHNDDPDFPTGNFAQQWESLKAYLNFPQITHPTEYKWFKPDDDPKMIGLKDELMQKLDQARTIAGVPFLITSGLRSVSQNTKVGGKPNSAHLTGEAADIECLTAANRWSMINAFLKVGFNRIEIAQDHIHVDISASLPQNIIDFSNLA